MSKIQTIIVNVLKSLPNEDAANAVLPTLVGYQDEKTGHVYTLEEIQGIADEQREKARKAREANAVKLANARKREALKALEGEVSALAVEFAPEILAVFAKVTAAGGSVTVDGEGNFAVSGLKARTGGNNGGGRIGKDDPSGYLDSEGNRILGPLTTWAKANFSEQELQDMGCYTPQSGKFRTGTKLAKALGDHVSVDPMGREVSEDTETDAE